LLACLVGLALSLIWVRAAPAEEYQGRDGFVYRREIGFRLERRQLGWSIECQTHVPGYGTDRTLETRFYWEDGHGSAAVYVCPIHERGGIVRLRWRKAGAPPSEQGAPVAVPEPRGALLVGVIALAIHHHNRRKGARP
jgi:hypothetical protein